MSTVEPDACCEFAVYDHEFGTARQMRRSALGGTQVTDAGVHELQKALPRVRIMLTR